MLHLLPRVVRKRLVTRKKKTLERVKPTYRNYADIAFLIQTFNKQNNLTRVLEPLLVGKAQNICLFADGCIDASARVAHKLLSGERHYVIQSNDTHEIANYRIGLKIAEALGCDYAILLQDDDVYNESLFTWIDSCKSKFSVDPCLAIIGGNGAANFVSEGCNSADQGLTTARFESWSEDGRSGYRLGDYQKMSYPCVTMSESAAGSVFAATVNRAPQMIKVPVALKMDFFPAILEPYQYDDDFNCLTAWRNGYKVLLHPCLGKTADVGIGGMRLYNCVMIDSRPAHFVRNWNFILKVFGQFIADGSLDALVAKANADRGAE